MTKNFAKITRKFFKLKLPHLDTVDMVMRKLEGSVLEELKRRMIQVFLNRKSLHKHHHYLEENFLLIMQFIDN